MGLRVFISRGRTGQFAGLVIDIEVTLTGAVDAIGPVQARVEPLRRVGGAALTAEHDAHFIIENVGVFFAVEIAAFPAPIGPSARQAVEYLGGLGLAAITLVFGQAGECGFIGNRAPQPRRHAFFFNALKGCWYARFAEVLLRQHVYCDLAPAIRDLDVFGLEDDLAVRISDLRRLGGKAKGVVGLWASLRLVRGSEPAFKLHAQYSFQGLAPIKGTANSK